MHDPETQRIIDARREMMAKQKAEGSNASPADLPENTEEAFTKKQKDEFIFMASDVWGISGLPLEKIKR